MNSIQTPRLDIILEASELEITEFCNKYIPEYKEDSHYNSTVKKTTVNRMLMQLHHIHPQLVGIKRLQEMNKQLKALTQAIQNK